ncbi:LysR family transcriptional regulator [Rhodobacteraceae bacterium NNCM2]|nr:LysR family transcriptional regulator [Coraliihabitans acroporae]
MQTRTLDTLVTIARTGSFQKAAAELHMTLSAVSMQMKTLEATLGVPLFDRSTRPPQLTPLGRQVERAAREVLAAEARMNDLCAAEGTLKGIYHIGFVPTASVRLAPSMLLAARRAFPAARFEMTTGLSDDLIHRVEAGELDAAVVTAQANIPGAIVLREEEIVWALPLSHSEMTVEECLADLPFIQFTPGTGIGILIEEHLNRAAQRPAEQILVDSVEAVMECVRAGIGFTALPLPDVNRYGDGMVASRSLSDPPLMRELSLISHARLGAGDQIGALAALFRA